MEDIVETWVLMVDMGVDGVRLLLLQPRVPRLVQCSSATLVSLKRIWIIMILDVRGSHVNHNDTCCLNPVAMEDVTKMSAMGLHQGVGTVLT
ncbi:unnamed protein product [Boreogadus saida]